MDVQRDSSSTIQDSSRAARAASLVSFLAFVWALVVFTTGGVRFHILAVAVSSRSPYPAVGLAVVAFALSLLLERQGRRLQAWDWLRDRIDRASPILVVGAMAAVVSVGIAYGARVGGGSDSFGYVSQAFLWMKGGLHVEEPLAGEAPWPRAGESFAPLGYRPGATPNTIVPAYPPGLPLMMAASYALSGPCGIYQIGPVFGAALVGIVFGLAARLTRDRLTSTLAAVLLASSPAFLFNQMVPMSDAVAAGLWLGALLTLTWPTVTHAAIASALAGIATLVRPNLAPLAVAGLVAAVMWRHNARPSARGLVFLAGVAAGSLAVLFVNFRLFGSPFRSGYGSLSTLFAFGHVTANFVSYGRWLLHSETAWILLALLPIVVSRMRPAWMTLRTVVPLALFAVILSVIYLLYLPFDHWMFLRFFLAGLPLLFILQSAALAWLARAIPSPIAVPGLVLLTIFLIHQRLDFVMSQRMLEMGEGEQRFLTIARYVDQQLPANAVILSKQHTGTIRFFSGRTTLRFEWLEPSRLGPAIAWLAERGRPPFIVLEDGEEEEFRRRFADQGSVGRLEIPPIAELTRPVRVRVYDPLQILAPTFTRIVSAPDRGCAEPHERWAPR
jgi:hypothetical protein